MKLSIGSDAPLSDMTVGRPHLKSMAAIFLLIVAFLAVSLLIFYNLPNFPSPWFDEGSHLHVPKSLVKFGEYADYSSEGFRYYGPSIGVGPTVMLPITAVFDLFGIGLLQARLVMAFYLLLAIIAFYLFVNNLGGRTLAVLSLIILLSTRSVLLLETGRQVLGEVPGFLFILAALLIWFSSWPKTKLVRLVIVGVLLGLAMITKYQFLLFMIPTLFLVWFLNLIYYKTLPQRILIVPILVSGFVFGLWVMFILAYLGPATFNENLNLLRESIAGAALIFNRTVMGNNLETLSGRAVYLGALLPALFYGVALALPRNPRAQKWSVLFILISVNLVWFLVASIGWLRYAFLGLGLTSIFIAQFFIDLTDNFKLGRRGLLAGLSKGKLENPRQLLNWALVLWLAVMIAIPLAKTVFEIFTVTQNPAQEMSAYLNETVPISKEIETWEPEMGFLTDHNYHYPPTPLLNKANAQMFLGGEPVSEFYSYLQTDEPEYVLIGNFAGWVELYPPDILQEKYTLEKSVGNYYLFTKDE